MGSSGGSDRSPLAGPMLRVDAQEHSSCRRVGSQEQIMNDRDWRFYGFVAGCLLAAGIFLAAMVDGQLGTRVAELPQNQHSETSQKPRM